MPAKLERAPIVAGALTGRLRDARRRAAVRLDDLLQISDFAVAVGGAEADGVANADSAVTFPDMLVLARAEVLKLTVQHGAVAEELVNVVAMKGAIDRGQIDLRRVTTELAHQLPLIAAG